MNALDKKLKRACQNVVLSVDKVRTLVRALHPLHPKLAEELIELAGCSADGDERREVFAYQAAAVEECKHIEGSSVDDDAAVSMGEDDGAYVQVWVWVRASRLNK